MRFLFIALPLLLAACDPQPVEQPHKVGVNVRNSPATEGTLADMMSNFTATHITTATTTAVRSSAGFLHMVCLNKLVASQTIELDDTIVDGGIGALGIITVPGTVTAADPFCMHYDVALTNGLTAVTVGSAVDITISSR